MNWQEVERECLKKRLKEEEVLKAHLTMDLKLREKAIAVIKKEIKRKEKEERKRNERKKRQRANS